MRLLIVSSLLTVLSFAAPATYADGLIYQLPADGTSVEFEMKLSFERNGQTMNMDGTFSMSSVGKETVDGEACRWVEFKMVWKQGDRDRTIHCKVLVPEKQLAAGKSPIKHVKKAWLKQGDGEAKEMTDFSDPQAGPLPAFLAGPFKDAQKLEAETVDSGLGKLECKGVTGSVQFKLGSRDQEFTFTNRLHKKAPFGVVAAEVQIEITRDGQQARSGTMQIKVSKVGKNAVTEIPNGN
ncbi:MAG: hypothetical protein IH899_09565 [Planctomycetes bacterium]|nr:hypothetical protein [Planctomycetota bacterium]